MFDRWQPLTVDRDNGLYNARLDQQLGGHEAQPTPKKYKDCNARILSIVRIFGERSSDSFRSDSIKFDVQLDINIYWLLFERYRFFIMNLHYFLWLHMHKIAMNCLIRITPFLREWFIRPEGFLTVFRGNFRGDVLGEKARGTCRENFLGDPKPRKTLLIHWTNIS